MNLQFLLPLGLFSGGIWQIVGESGLFGTIILIVLLLFSLVSWGIIFNKWRLFKKVEEQNALFLNSFRRSKKFSDLVNQANTFKLTPLSGLFLAGYNEIRELLSNKNQNPGNPDDAVVLDERETEIIDMTLQRITAVEIGRLEKYVVFLATTANASPFLGLLGTVVGVMDAFWSIGERGSASLAVVAPGIAQALLATIVGLGAAIPAVIAYNWAGNKLKYLNDAANNFTLEFQTRIKKDLT